MLQWLKRLLPLPLRKFLYPLTHTLEGYFLARHYRRIYGQIVKPGDFVYDIGANVGDHTAIFRQLGARVLAVEPVYYWVLESRFRDDLDVSIAPFACGSHPQKDVIIHESDIIGYTTFHPDERHPDIPFYKKHSVSVWPIYQLEQVHGRPNLVKIDVEGHEESVIQGLGSRPDRVIFEFSARMLDSVRNCLVRLKPAKFNVINHKNYRWVFDEPVEDYVLMAYLAKLPKDDSGDIIAWLS